MESKAFLRRRIALADDPIDCGHLFCSLDKSIVEGKQAEIGLRIQHRIVYLTGRPLVASAECLDCRSGRASVQYHSQIVQQFGIPYVGKLERFYQMPALDSPRLCRSFLPHPVFKIAERNSNLVVRPCTAPVEFLPRSVDLSGNRERPLAGILFR